MSEQICKKIPKHQMGNVVSPKGIKTPRMRFKEQPATSASYPKKRVKLIPKNQEGGLLGKILSYYPGTALQMTLAKKFTSRVADNMYPYSYENPARRIISAGVLGRKFYKDTGIPYMDEALHERQDLLHMLLNKKPHNNVITESPYKPTKAENPNAKYYRSPFVEKSIRDQLIGKESFGKERLENNIANAGGVVLGNYSTNRGKDDKGDYISYYDKWDLNPVPKTGVNWIDKTVDKVVTGIPQALGLATTPEIYGRVYVDEAGKPKLKKGGFIPKYQTGNRISQEEMDKFNSQGTGTISQTSTGWKSKLGKVINRIVENQPEGVKMFGSFAPGYGDALDVAETTKAFATGDAGDKAMAIAGAALPFVSTKILKGVIEKIPSELFNLNNIKKPNGAIGNQGFTSEGVQNILNHLGIKPQTNSNAPSMREMVDHLKTNKGDADKYYKFLEKEPINVSVLPDGTHHLTDGHHRATLAYHAGMTDIPAIIKK